jgi:hypothetical protein
MGAQSHRGDPLGPTRSRMSCLPDGRPADGRTHSSSMDLEVYLNPSRRTCRAIEQVNSNNQISNKQSQLQQKCLPNFTILLQHLSTPLRRRSFSSMLLSCRRPCGLIKSPTSRLNSPTQTSFSSTSTDTEKLLKEGNTSLYTINAMTSLLSWYRPLPSSSNLRTNCPSAPPSLSASPLAP